MRKESYRAIINASENNSLKESVDQLQKLTRVAQCCIHALRKNDTVWERKARLLALPEPSQQELDKVTAFLRRYPWWTRRPYVLRHSKRGQPRALDSQECKRAKEMILDLVQEENWSVKNAVDQASIRFVVSPRTMMKIWTNQYKPKNGESTPK